MRPASLLRALLLIVPLVVAGALLLRGCGGAERPSIVLVTLDTTRPDHLSCYGYPRPTSPALDALAARGVAFSGWAQAAETGPSLASTLTSRRAPVTGVRGNAERLDARLPTLATVASDAGYRTGAFVSTVLLRKDVCGFDRGFDVYDDEMTDPCFGHERAQRVAERTIDRALAWLDQSEHDERPFLLWVHLYDPHGPYTPPERTPRLESSVEAARDGLARGPFSQPFRPDRIPRYQRVGDSVDPADYVDRYDHEIAYMDRHLGRLLERLAPDSTLVAVHADHGEALGEDGYWFRHGSLLHDAALRVPIVLAGPGVPASSSPRRAPLRNLDLVPTLARLAGLPALPGAEGLDASARLGAVAPVSPPAMIAEARKREIVGDSTGIDTRWKLRCRVGDVDVTWWPGSGNVRAPRVPYATREAVLEAMRTWLVEPERPASRSEPGSDIDDALRGLGYVPEVRTSTDGR